MHKEFNNLCEDMKQLEKNASNLKPILISIGDAAKDISKESFKKEISPFGDKWAPLSKRTLKAKKQNKDKILTKTENLKNRINAEHSIQEVSKDKIKGIVSIGSNVGYAPIHQFGGKAGRGLRAHIPARVFLPVNAKGDISKELKEKIESIVFSHLGLKDLNRH